MAGATGTTTGAATGAAGAAGIALGAAGGGGASSFTPGSATFTAIYQEIISGTGCNGGGTCHAASVAGNLRMAKQADAYIALVGMPAMGINLPPGGTDCKTTGLQRVKPGDPDNSLIVHKISDDMPPCGNHMPPGGHLKPEQIQQIKDWIMAGAMNN